MFVGLIVVFFMIATLVFFGVRFIQKNRDSQNVSSKEKRDFAVLIGQLERLGYYKFMKPSDIDEVKSNSIAANYIYGWEETGRDFSADQEELAEGYVGEFIESLHVFLRHEKVMIEHVDDLFADDNKGYQIIIDGRSYTIYSDEESNASNVWELSAIRTCSIVNELLCDAGSKERLYLLFGGNDGRVVFLTDAMYELIMKQELIPITDKPVIV